MLNKLAAILMLASFFWSSPAYGQEGKFTLVPRGGVVPFESTCFDNEATARLLAWREFQQKEFENSLELKLGLQREEFTLELSTLKVSLEETTIRYNDSIRLRDEEIDSLRTIIKKDRKVNLPLVVAGSVLAGVAVGIGAAYAIDQAFQ